jgi:hypothetical protein
MEKKEQQKENPYSVLDNKYYAFNLLKVSLDYAFENPELTENIGYKITKIEPIIQEKATT